MTRHAPGSIEVAEHFLAINSPDASPEAIEAALSWIEEDPAHRAAFRQMAIFSSSCDEIIEVLPPDEIAKELNAFTSFAGRLPWLKPAVVALAAMAASLGILFLAFAFWGNFGSPTQDARTQYATATGEIRKIRLPDGSIAELGGSSGISVTYSAGRRDIALTDGEAYFNVAHDAARPFLVSAGTGLVRAVGTQFSVQRTLKGIQVAVAEGKVRVTSQNEAVDLPAGRQVLYSSDGKMSYVSLIAARQIAGWRHGILQYRDTPFSEVIADLNRYSRKPIILSGHNIEAERITGAVRIDSLEDWLAGVAAAGDFEMINHRQGAIVLCEFHNCGMSSD